MNNRNVIVNSISRCGSTMMYQYISDIGWKKCRISGELFRLEMCNWGPPQTRTVYHNHASTPCHFSNDRKYKVIYMFGDVYNTVIANMRDSENRTNNKYNPWEEIRTQFSMPEFYSDKNFLDFDLFNFPGHFDSWNKSNNTFDLLSLKYETLWDNLDAVKDFLEISDKDISKFPAYKQRKTSYDYLSSSEFQRLEKTYKYSKEYLESKPDVQLFKKK